MVDCATILVGGPSRGTRFRPLSLDVPKPLFPIAGVPMIHHHIAALNRLGTVKDVFLIGFYEDSVFKQFIDDISQEFPSMHFRYLREYQSLGTAGGLNLFRDAILKSNPEHLFVMHADVCCSFPLSQLRELHDTKNAAATIIGTRVAREAAPNFGSIVADENNAVVHYVEKPESFVSDLISCGVYVFNPHSLFAYIKEQVARKAAAAADAAPTLDEDSPSDDRIRLEQDVIAPLAQEPEHRLFVYETRDFWRQIKTAGSSVPANGLYLKQAMEAGDPSVLRTSRDGPEILGPVYVHPSAYVHPTAKLGPFVSIGAKSRIGEGVRIKDSIILDGTEVKDNACILHSIIASGCKVGAWARVEGTPTLATQHNMTVMRNGAKVQSITVCASDVSIGNEVHLQNCIVLPHKDIKRGVVGEVIM